MNTRSFLGASAMLLAALGCGDDTTAPTEQAPTSPQAAVATATTALSFWQMSAGQYHTCGVTIDYHAYCWGYDASGQLGDGGQVGTIGVPYPVVGGYSFKQIDAGGRGTCALTTGNRIYCWGDDVTSMPHGVATTRSFRQVSVGGFHKCAVAADYRVYCWGDNTYGQLGDGTTSVRSGLVAVLGGLYFKQVSAGDRHTCAVTTANRAYCWGSNQYGQVGDSSTASKRLRPTRVRTTRQFRQIDAGGNHSCAVTPDNRAFCWGQNGVGQLGDGTTTLRRWPRAVVGGLYFARITTGYGHTCAETTGNRAYCWGGNFDGQLGDGTTTRRLRPTAVVGGLYFKQVSAGWDHTCGKTDKSLGYCWGRDLDGQLGDNGYYSQSTPTPVLGPPW